MAYACLRVYACGITRVSLAPLVARRRDISPLPGPTDLVPMLLEVRGVCWFGIYTVERTLALKILIYAQLPTDTLPSRNIPLPCLYAAAAKRGSVHVAHSAEVSRRHDHD